MYNGAKTTVLLVAYCRRKRDIDPFMFYDDMDSDTHEHPGPFLSRPTACVSSGMSFSLSGSLSYHVLYMSEALVSGSFPALKFYDLTRSKQVAC